MLTCGAPEAVAGWVVAELIFTEQARPPSSSAESAANRTRSIRAPKVLPVLIDMEDEATWFIKNLVVRVDLEGVLRQPNPSSMFRRKSPLIIAR